MMKSKTDIRIKIKTDILKAYKKLSKTLQLSNLTFLENAERDTFITAYAISSFGFILWQYNENTKEINESWLTVKDILNLCKSQNLTSLDIDLRQ